MKATRRRFIQTSAMVGAGVMLAGRRLIGRAVGDPIKNLRKFVDPLPLPGFNSGQALSLATPNKTIYNQTGAQADFYRITMGQYQWQFHSDLPPTSVWGYADITDDRLAQVRLPRCLDRRDRGDADAHRLREPAAAQAHLAHRHDHPRGGDRPGCQPRRGAPARRLRAVAE